MATTIRRTWPTWSVVDGDEVIASGLWRRRTAQHIADSRLVSARLAAIVGDGR